jgi:hypothetical protein
MREHGTRAARFGFSSDGSIEASSRNNEANRARFIAFHGCILAQTAVATALRAVSSRASSEDGSRMGDDDRETL